MSNVWEQMAALRERSGLSMERLAKLVGLAGASSWQRYELETTYKKRKLLAPEMAHKLVRALAGRGDPVISADEIYDLAGMTANITPTTAPGDLGDLSLVPELDLRAISGLGGSSLEVTKENVEAVTRARYGFPEEHFRQIVGVGTGMADIAEVVGDSMYPTLIPGEKVVLNRADRIPSPPGIFVVWDGLGLVMKRVSFAPHSNPPMVRIASDNPAYEPYDRSLDEAHILARVVGKFSRTG